MHIHNIISLSPFHILLELCVRQEAVVVMMTVGQQAEGVHTLTFTPESYFPLVYRPASSQSRFLVPWLFYRSGFDKGGRGDPKVVLLLMVLQYRK